MSTYRRRIGDTVNNGVAWKTPSCICSCQWRIKSEVFCGNCWMLRRRLEAATGCRRGPQYDGKCSFYLNCYFFRTSPTNRDLREKAVYFPPQMPGNHFAYAATRGIKQNGSNLAKGLQAPAFSYSQSMRTFFCVCLLLSMLTLLILPNLFSISFHLFLCHCA